MKKSILLIMLVFSLILINGVLAIDFKECNKDCIKDTQIRTNDCRNEFNYCFQDANQAINDCKEFSGKNKTDCLKDARIELSKCGSDKTNCLKTMNDDITRCKKKCFYVGKNITCGEYNAGDVFLKDCNKCECNGNGKISCKTTEYCNFNILIGKEECSDGLFQKLCAGSIYSAKCTQEVYCQCGESLNFTCNNDSICLYDFYLNKNRRGQFAQDWIKFPEYKKLGNIGVCVKKPILESCGNGVCENICNNSNCSLAETSYNCEEDC